MKDDNSGSDHRREAAKQVDIMILIMTMLTTMYRSCAVRNLTPEMEQLLAAAGRLRVGDAALRARGGAGAGAEQPAAHQDPLRGHGCRPRNARGRGLDRGRGRARLQPVGRQRGGGRGALPH